MGKLYILVWLVMSGCSTCTVLSDTVEHTGTVYDCGRVEYCYRESSARELSRMTGLRCTESDITDRWWPGLTNAIGLGCYYECPPKHEGCNATGGCWCPP